MEPPAPHRKTDRLPPLVTLHGVNSRGEWQELLRPLFEPHFRYIPLSYPLFRGWGPIPAGILKVVVDPGVLAMTAVGAALLVLLGRATVWTGLFVLVGVLVGAGASWFRRRIAYQRVVKDYDKESLPGETPHAIAHSFGTFLWGRLMQRATTRCGRVVFAGSVLSRSFVTSKLPGGDERPFKEIRNEVGSRDHVAGMAGALWRVVPDLGDAGLRGFEGPAEHFHGVEDSYGKCRACEEATDPPSWLVHNIQLPYAAHNDLFITEKHAFYFWLPFLWGVQPREFVDWLEWCRAAHAWNQPGYLKRAALAAEARILRRQWWWAGGNLDDLVRREYPAAVTIIADSVSAVRLWRTTWKVVVEACDHCMTHRRNPDRMARARALDPHTALEVAITHILGR